MSEEEPVQNFGSDEFEYLADVGDWCVIRVPAETLIADVDDHISLGNAGDEGDYWIYALLPLHPDCFSGERPTAVVLYHQPPDL